MEQKTQENPIKLDETDRKLLNLLYEDSRKTLKQLAKEASVSIDLAYRRIKRLKENGVIEQFIVDIDLPKAGYAYGAFMVIKLTKLTDERYNQFIKHLRSNSAVIRFYSVFGEWDFSMTLIAKTRKELDKIVQDIRYKFNDIIQNYQAVVILDRYKNKLSL